MTTAPALPPAARPAGAPWTLHDAWQFLHLGERTLRRLTSARKVRTIKLAGRTLIPDDEVRRLASQGTA